MSPRGRVLPGPGQPHLRLAEQLHGWVRRPRGDRALRDRSASGRPRRGRARGILARGVSEPPRRRRPAGAGTHRSHRALHQRPRPHPRRHRTAVPRWRRAGESMKVASRRGPVTDEQIYDRRWWTLAVLVLSLIIIFVGNSSLNVAIPVLSRELHATTSQLQWVVAIYSLVFAGLLFTTGALGDRYG